MSHISPRKTGDEMGLLGRTQQSISRSLERFVESYYRPFLQRCLNNRSITLALIIGLSVIIMAAINYGQIRTSQFPRIEGDSVQVNLTMPESTGIEATKKHISDIVRHFKTVQKKYSDPETGVSVITHILATSGSQGGSAGSNVGRVTAELQTSTERIIDVSSQKLSREVRQLIGQIPGAQSLGIRATLGRFVAPINVVLKGDRDDDTSDIINKIKTELASYPGVFEIQDNFTGGKEEYSLNLKPRAYALGLNLREVADQVRYALFGFQAQRVQRDRNELRVMVRHPIADRSSISDLQQLLIQVPGSQETVLLSEIASVSPSESPSTLYRDNRESIVNITADLDSDVANGELIAVTLEQFLNELKQAYPNLNYELDGDIKDGQESNQRLAIGVLLVLAAIYALLAIPFKSYAQPLVVMSVIPFGLVGAIVGHVLTGQVLTSLSMFGMLALIGVMVNDSLVLVDYINKCRARGMEVFEAVSHAAGIRFRPVILTSITTFAGLMPILLDKSQQAKWLKPMATSLGFGIVFATIVTLIIVPVIYISGRNFKIRSKQIFNSGWTGWLKFWNKEDPRHV